MDYVGVTIAHVITRFINGGADENTLEACNWSARRGDSVHLLFGSAFDQAIVDKLDARVEVIVIPDLVNPIDPIRDARAFFQIRAELQRIRPDLVHTHTSKAGVLGRAAARSISVPAIIHGVHIAPFQNVGFLKRHLYLTLERLAARWTDAFISVSEGMQQAYLSEGIGDPDVHSVIHSGMNIRKYQVSAPENWRALLGLTASDSKPKVVLMIAGLERRKRHVELIAAFDKVFERVPDALLVLAGGGKEKTAIESRIEASRFRDRIRVLGHVDDPGPLIALADLAVHCAEREGLPRVIVQYLAGGLPVVMTRLPGVGGLIVDGANGRLVDQDDFSGLAAVVAETLSYPDLLDALREGAEEKDVSAWDMNVTGRNQQAVYEKVMRGAQPVDVEKQARATP